MSSHGSMGDDYERRISQENTVNKPLFSDQQQKLGTERETSSIPMAPTTNSKVNEKQNWIYPSEQMFYNAIRRKEAAGEYDTVIGERNKTNLNIKSDHPSTIKQISRNGGDEDKSIARESDIKFILQIHNAVNEMCWQQILRWERAIQTRDAEKLANQMFEASKNLLDSDGSIDNPNYPVIPEFACQPKLVRFQGRPRDYTPKALFRHYILGYRLPFDRHDWIVDRCGKQVRYVIDFYSGGNNPSSNNNNGMPSFYIDARRDLSWDGLKDRFTKFWTTGSGLW